MQNELPIYDQFAQLLEYPQPNIHQIAQRCRDLLEVGFPQESSAVERFIAQIKDLSYEDIEELYSRTFDMGPTCTLEIGWHLFGENYDRGTFLVWMRQQLRDWSIDESGELPDHAMHVLRILGRIEPFKANGFSTACVLPALTVVQSGLRGKDNPFEHILNAVCQFLTIQHGPITDEDVTSLPIINNHEELLAKESV